MKGVILSQAPGTSLLDVTHHIEPGHIRSGAYTVWATHPHLPKGTVCLAVVDPGVGTEREIICSVVEERTYLAPDNGLLDMLLANRDGVQTYTLSMKKMRRFLPDDISSSFHGRDIFAPVGAQLALGLAPGEIGTRRKDLKPAEWRVIDRTSTVPPAIMSVDRFGNVITNIVSKDIARIQENIRAISVGKVMISVAAGTFEGAPENTPCIMSGSSGLVEIIVRNGSAADILRVNDRSSLRVLWSKDIDEQ